MTGAASLPPSVREALDRGAFCHAAAATPTGPHVTPMVFAVAGDRVWVTTSRGSVKARAWRADRRVSGVVRSGDEAVAFGGTASMHDALDPASWARSLLRAPVLGVAAVRFTRKNARFFAGYAVDASRVPFAWTPPGRVFVELRVERAELMKTASAVGVPSGSAPAVGDPADRTCATTGAWPDGHGTLERFRARRTGPDPLSPLPAEVRAVLGDAGRGVLAVEGGSGPATLPVAWIVDGAGLYAAVRSEVLDLAGSPSSPRAALCMDRPSTWRARQMVGAMARGDAEVYDLGSLSSGERSAAEIVRRTDVALERAVLVRMRPSRFVWWRGWESGTATVPSQR